MPWPCRRTVEGNVPMPDTSVANGGVSCEGAGESSERATRATRAGEVSQERTQKRTDVHASKVEEKAALFRRGGMPPVKDLIPITLQHVLSSFAGVIAPAIIIAGVCNFSEEQETAIIQVALILSAIDTILQQFPLFGRIGSGLPILTGVSFAFLPAFQAVGIEFGFPTLLGAELVGGTVAILFGTFYPKVKWLFPSLVTGTVIFTIGVSLYPTPSSTSPAAWEPRASVGFRTGSWASSRLPRFLGSPTLARASSSSAASSLACSWACSSPCRLGWSTPRVWQAPAGLLCLGSCRSGSSSTRQHASRSQWST